MHNTLLNKVEPIKILLNDKYRTHVGRKTISRIYQHTPIQCSRGVILLMTFSRQNTIKYGLEIKLRRAKTKAKNHAKGKMGTIDKDWKLQHGDWINEAKLGKYDSLIKKITQDEKNRVALAMQRRAKLIGKS